MSDTPRTDEAQWGTGRVTVDFARELERELAELKHGATCIHHNDAQRRRCTVCRCTELERELAEQVLCNGKGAEREADLLGKVERLERENARLRRVADLARDAVESGAIEEVYLSLLRDALALCDTQTPVK